MGRGPAAVVGTVRAGREKDGGRVTCQRGPRGQGGIHVRAGRALIMTQTDGERAASWEPGMPLNGSFRSAGM